MAVFSHHLSSTQKIWKMVNEKNYKHKNTAFYKSYNLPFHHNQTPISRKKTTKWSLFTYWLWTSIELANTRPISQHENCLQQQIWFKFEECYLALTFSSQESIKAKGKNHRKHVYRRTISKLVTLPSCNSLVFLCF